MTTTMTHHAAVRAQQRGVPILIREWLLDYGAITMRHGALIRYFDKEAKRRLQKDMGAQVVDRLGDLLNMYLVEGDGGKIVTAGRRIKAIKRN
jgi:hypothetical protein